MGQLDKMANALFGGKRAETQDGFAQDKTATIIGTAVTDSDSGAVMVELSSDVTNPEPVEIDGETYFEDASTAVELPTTQAVQAGDEVLVSVYGGTALKNGVVTGVVGSGDRIAADAEAAREIAEATGQHFWHDGNGAHVTELARPDWETQQTGPNSVWNSLGMLFRNGLNNLLALIPSEGEGYTETFTTDAYVMFVELSRTPDVVNSVKIDGIETNDYTVWGNVIDFPQAISEGHTIEVSYRIGGSSMALFDGLGNLSENIVASFGASGARIGYERAGHVKINPSSMDIMNGDKPVASFGQYTRMYYDGEEVFRLAPGEIDFSEWPYASAIRFNMNAGISSDLVTVGGVDQAALTLDGDRLALNWQVPSWGSEEVTMEQAAAMLTTASHTLARSSAASSWSGGQVRRSGKVVTVTIVGMKLASALASNANSAQITTLPAGFTPNLIQRVPCALDGAGNYANVWAAIGTGGGIQIHNGSPTAIPTNREISLNCTYIID